MQKIKNNIMKVLIFILFFTCKKSIIIIINNYPVNENVLQKYSQKILFPFF